MKIGIDIRAACEKKTGKGLYTFNLVKNLLALDRKNEYILYTNAISGNLAKMLIPPTTLNPQPSILNPHIKLIHKSSWLWHFSVIKDFKAQNGNVFFAPTSYIIPVFLPKKIKSVITVHDLVAFLHPHLHEPKAAILEWLFLKLALKKTHKILAPSQNTKNDLMKIFHCHEEKIIVTPLAAAEEFFKKPAPEHLHEIKKKYNLPEEFILTVAGLEPRKNVTALVDAVLELNKNLVIIGGKGWKSGALQKKISKNKKHIIHITHCPPEDLASFYASAKNFVFPSIYEGFGLPPLEAMASGCPVICSNTASLPEVCGDGAILIDPNNPSELKNAIEKLWNDKKLQDNLREKGFTQAQKFSWHATAKKTLAVLNAD